MSRTADNKVMAELSPQMKLFAAEVAAQLVRTDKFQEILREELEKLAQQVELNQLNLNESLLSMAKGVSKQAR